MSSTERINGRGGDVRPLLVSGGPHRSVNQNVWRKNTRFEERFFGPLRHLRNPYSERLLEMKEKGASDMEILKYELEGSHKAFGPAGDVENGAIWSGQVATRLSDIPKVSELIERIMREAEEHISFLCEMYG
ncbi:MAG: hypothetical protein PHP64_06080 [Actinomycetota bacterium]|nr:hypothetical protein [Actinomycetota bacterium]